MSAETEQGLNALQSGNVAEAVTLLERATQADPTDYHAFMYLGAAYGQAERHEDAIIALTQAVVLQPVNAQIHYNLGAAIERAGRIPQALEAYRQALQIQPGYGKAQEAAQRLQSVEASLPVSKPSAVPETTQILSGSAPLSEIPAQRYAPPVPAPPVGGSYAAPGYAAGAAPHPSRSAESTAADKFDLKQAARDWIQIIRAPKTFFDGQAERTGANAPISFLFFSALIPTVLALFGGGIRLYQEYAFTGVFTDFEGLLPAVGTLLLAVVLNLTIFFALGVLLLRVFALLYHAVGRRFGSQADVSGSFRALAYCQAPLLVRALVVVLAAFFAHPPPYTAAVAQSRGLRLVRIQGSSNPNESFRVIDRSPADPNTADENFRHGLVAQTGSSSYSVLFGSLTALDGLMGLDGLGLLLSIGFYVWTLTLLVMATGRIQRISTEAAMGTAFAAGLTVLVICAALGFALVALFTALSGAR